MLEDDLCIGRLFPYCRRVIEFDLIVIFYLTAGAGAFGSSPREPKYKIEIHPEEAPFHPVSMLSA